MPINWKVVLFCGAFCISCATEAGRPNPTISWDADPEALARAAGHDLDDLKRSVRVLIEANDGSQINVSRILAQVILLARHDASAASAVASDVLNGRYSSKLDHALESRLTHFSALIMAMNGSADPLVALVDGKPSLIDAEAAASGGDFRWSTLMTNALREGRSAEFCEASKRLGPFLKRSDMRVQLVDALEVRLLRPPGGQREWERVAQICAAQGLSYASQFLSKPRRLALNEAAAEFVSDGELRTGLELAAGMHALSGSRWRTMEAAQRCMFQAEDYRDRWLCRSFSTAHGYSALSPGALFPDAPAIEETLGVISAGKQGSRHWIRSASPDLMALYFKSITQMEFIDVVNIVQFGDFSEERMGEIAVAIRNSDRFARSVSAEWLLAAAGSDSNSQEFRRAKASVLAKGNEAQKANLLARFSSPDSPATLRQWGSRLRSKTGFDRLVALEDLSVLCKTGISAPAEPIADVALYEYKLRNQLKGCELAEMLLVSVENHGSATIQTPGIRSKSQDTRDSEIRARSGREQRL